MTPHEKADAIEKMLKRYGFTMGDFIMFLAKVDEELIHNKSPEFIAAVMIYGNINETLLKHGLKPLHEFESFEIADSTQRPFNIQKEGMSLQGILKRRHKLLKALMAIPAKCRTKAIDGITSDIYCLHYAGN